MRRRSNARPLFFWSGILLLTVLLASFAVGSMSLPGELFQTPTPSARPVATATLPAAPILSDSRGFVAIDGDRRARLRRETSREGVGTLDGTGFIGAVSSTGRRVAYWVSSTADGATRELRVFDVAAPDQDTLIANLPSGERGAGLVWSSDRTGLVAVVESSDVTGSGGAPFSALRAIDVPTRTTIEIARLVDGSLFWPVGWDRDAGQTGACIYLPDGSAIGYVITGEDTLSVRVPMEPGINVRTVRSSGTSVLGLVGGSLIRVWTIASYDEHHELGAANGDRITLARWIPGRAEIAVIVGDRLEVWAASGGARRVVAREVLSAADLLVSSDGALAFVTFDEGKRAVAFELATGLTAPILMSDQRLAAPVSFR